MLDGEPPKRFPNRELLLDVFLGSRDSTKTPAVPGADGVTADQFRAKLQQNIDRLYTDLRHRRFHFSKLRPIPIPKLNGQFRVICVPTVKDRLVQRSIIDWLVARGKFPAGGSTFWIRERGVQLALRKALELRRENEWCVKTDIERFFDNIKREPLKRLVRTKLRKTSVLPLVLSAIDSEATLPRGSRIATIAADSGLLPGRGIRQGMPLSPLLANISLSKFDARCQARGVNFIRYADDIIAFFKTESDARIGFDFIRTELTKLELSIPDMGAPKSMRVPPKQPVTFLGQELVYRDGVRDYVRRIGSAKAAAIRTEIKTEFALAKLIGDENISSAVEGLTASVKSYLGAYQGADDYAHFEGEMRALLRSTVRGWLKDIFGNEVIARLSPSHQRFLGIPLEPDVAAAGDIEIAN